MAGFTLSPAVIKAMQDIIHGGHIPNLPPQTPGYAQVSGTVPIGQPAGQRFMENGIQAQPAPSMPMAPQAPQTSPQPSLAASFASGNPLTMAIASALQSGQNATDPGTYRKSADAQSQQATTTYNQALTKPKPKPSFSLGTKDLIAPLAMLVGKLLFHSRDSDLSQFAGAYLGERQRGAAEKDAYSMDQYNREQDAAKVQYGTDMDKVKRTMDFMEDIRKTATEDYRDKRNFEQQLAVGRENNKAIADRQKADDARAEELRMNSALYKTLDAQRNSLPDGPEKMKAAELLLKIRHNQYDDALDGMALREVLSKPTQKNIETGLDIKKKEFDLAKMPERYAREVEKWGLDKEGKRLDNIWQSLKNKSYPEDQAFKRMMIALHIQNFNRGVANDKLDNWYKQSKPLLESMQAVEKQVEAARIAVNAQSRKNQAYEAQHFVNNEWDSPASEQVYKAMKDEWYRLSTEYHRRVSEREKAVIEVPDPPSYDIKQIDKTSIPKSWGKLPDVMIGGPSGGGELKPNNAPIPKMVTSKSPTSKPKLKAGGKPQTDAERIAAAKARMKGK